MNTEATAEDRAAQMGWKPKDQFKGPEDRWVDAETYIKRGEDIEPILRANNKKLLDKVQTLETDLQSTKTLLAASSESIEELKKFNTEAARAAAKTQQAEIIAGIRAARESGDVETETQLIDQLTDSKAALKVAEATKKPEPKTGDAPPPLTPEVKQWLQDNPWFGTDKRRTALAFGIAEELRAAGDKPNTLEFYQKVGAEVEKTLGGNSRREAPSKVEGANGAAGGTSSGKSYADLPADAKEACEKMAKKLVGAGRAYKTEADWRKAYVAKYDWS
jgi:hypothetical protein